MQLFVRCPLIDAMGGGHFGTIVLDVHPTDTIAEVKLKVYEKGGATPQKQYLMFLNEPLYDNRTLESYKIGNNCLVQTDTWIAVQNPDFGTFLLNIDLKDTVSSVKARIEQEKQIPHDKQIVFSAGGEMRSMPVSLLDDSKTLHDYGIRNESRLNVAVQSPYTNFGGVLIYVKDRYSGDEVIALKVELNQTVAVVKLLVFNEIGVLPEEQKLTTELGLEMIKQPLNCYGIVPQSTIYWERTMHYPNRCICVKTPTGKTVSVKVHSKDVFEFVKMKIEEETGIPFYIQQLVLGGIPVENDVTVGEYTISQLNMLHLQISNLDNVVTIETGDEERVFYRHVTTSFKIFYLKYSIFLSDGIPIDHQVLFYDGNKLQDDKTLQHYNILDSCVLQLEITKHRQHMIHVATNDLTLTLDASPATSIYELKKITGCEIKSLNTETELIYNGKFLDPCRTLGDYGIENGGCIFSISKHGITIHIESIDKKRLTMLQVGFLETILSIKVRIQAEVSGMPPPSQQRLTIRGCVLEDTQTLEEVVTYCNQAVISMSIVPKKVFIRYSRRSVGRTLEVQIPSMATIFDLKHSVYQKMGIDPNRQHLYYDGKVLDDGQSIEDCALPSQPTIQLCLTQCIHDMLQEDVPSEGKQIFWKQYGVEVTVLSRVAPKCSAQLRVYDDRTTTCFEYPAEYTPVSNVYEISLSSGTRPPTADVIVALTNFRQPRGQDRLCVMAASRDPSKWTPDQLTPLFSFSEVDGLNLQPGTKRVELDCMGGYLFVATHLPVSDHPATSKPDKAAPPVSSPEHRTMVRCTPQLTDTLTADPLRVSEGLYAVFLIPQAIQDLVLHGTMPPREKASRLVASMTDRVSASPSDFSKFVSVLREQGSWTDHIVSLLEATLVETKYDSS